ncbi:hypothetical protein [uncultured Phocaeicola sp.]|uniref:hypothetical protein n=1 Tax=uncultured Phocaeicola sp. TaxID=990718 RepID=UPI0025A07AE7|nr:hypothetical protein [uncultured Phocaeicola sp.]
MQKQLEQYFGCKVKIAEYKNKLQLPIFMTMRDIMMVEIYGVNFAIIDPYHAKASTALNN